ncbi:VOC family protein [Pseudoxanthomonas sp. SGD-10]|nr:VOC family protein [Pseudoxanthomonas sp. SGD-10]
MKHHIYPCLWFDHQGQEAVEFYSKVFYDAEIKQSSALLTVFAIKGKQFIALNGATVKPNPSMSLFVICASEEEILYSWNKLSEGGQILMPLDSYPWSKKYGWVQDKFGFSWQLSLEMNIGEHTDVFPTLMFTGENSGRAEEAINFYTSLFENSRIEIMSKYEPGENDVVGNIKHAQFYIDGYRMAAMDSGYPHGFSFNEAVSIVVHCDTQQEIDFYWINLTEGGLESMCGWCQDTYGVWWQIVPAILGELMNDSIKGNKVLNALRKMKKLDINTLIQAGGE